MGPVWTWPCSWRGQRQPLQECMQMWSHKRCLELWLTCPHYPSMHPIPHWIPTPASPVSVLLSIEAEMPFIKRVWTHGRNEAGLDISLYLNRLNLAIASVQVEAVDWELSGTLFAETVPVHLSTAAGVRSSPSSACAAFHYGWRCHCQGRVHT